MGAKTFKLYLPNQIDPSEETHPKSEIPSPVCPYLKLEWDDSLKYGFPDKANHCYWTQKAQPVSLTHQERVCLHGAYQDCQVFAPKLEEVVLEEDYAGPTPVPSRYNFGFIGILILVIAFFIVGVLRMQVLRTVQPGSSSTPVVTATRSPSPSPKAMLTVTPTAIAIPVKAKPLTPDASKPVQSSDSSETSLSQ
jgi:hypothetical protein